ncbi:MAG: Ig domain-containing protein [Gemmatimonadales bacterium]
MATVAVTLSAGTVPVGQTTTATATARTAAGVTVTGRTVAWSTGAEPVATVSVAGLVTAVAPGLAPITATIDGQTGSAEVTVVPLEAARCRDCLEVVPATALVVPGASLAASADVGRQLTVYRVDAAGVRSVVPATFVSSDPAVVVSPTGKVSAAAVGSGKVVAQAGGLTSDPVVVLAAEPAGGALLVADEQLVGAPVPVDSSAAYGPGYRYRVRLRQAVPVVGQLVIGTGHAPLGGRTVSATAAGPELTDVVLEIVPLREMFAQLSLDQQLTLDSASVAAPAGTPGGPAAVVRAGQRYGISNFRPAGAPNEFEMSLGPFECKASVQGALTFPLSVDGLDVDINPLLHLDIRIAGGGVERLMVTGSLAPTFSSELRFSGGVQGTLDCQWTIRTVILPIGGPIALIVGGQIPVGVGFGVGAKAELGGFGYDAFLRSDVDVAVGLDCAGGCHAVADVETSSDGFFKPRLPSSLDTLKLEVTGNAYLFAKLQIGNPFLRALQFETVSVKAGLEQKAELAAERTQVRDPAYASGIKLVGFFEAGTGSAVAAAGRLLNISLASFKVRPEVPLGLSPRGTFSISPGTVRAGDASALGDQATFTVDLDPVTYFGAYAVDGVEIRRIRPDGQGGIQLEPGRPGCTFIPATPGQTSFSCQTDFVAADTGSHSFAAFVHARIFGVPVPILFEVGPAGQAGVQVQPPGPGDPPPPPLSCPDVEIDIFTPEDLAAARSLACIEFLWIDPDEDSMDIDLGSLRVAEDIVVQGTVRSLSLTGLQWADKISVRGTELVKLQLAAPFVETLEVEGNERLEQVRLAGLKWTGQILLYDNPMLRELTVPCSVQFVSDPFLYVGFSPALSAATMETLARCLGLAPEQYLFEGLGSLRSGATAGLGPSTAAIRRLNPPVAPRSGRGAPPARPEARRRAPRSRASAAVPR